MSKPVVLLIDDEGDFVESLKEYLEDEVLGVAFEAFTKGSDALARLADGNVHAVVTDFNMPGMDGMSLLKNLDMLAPKVPRIMITAMADVELATAAVNEGRVQYFFPKPVDPAKLAKAVHKLVWQFQEGEMSEARFLKRYGAAGSRDGDL